MEWFNNLNPTVAAAIVAGIVGLITGAVGSLIAPWVNWGIEKRRERDKQRRKYIVEWRSYASRKPSKDYLSFLDSAEFQQMKPYLNPKIRHVLQEIQKKSDFDISHNEVISYLRILDPKAKKPTLQSYDPKRLDSPTTGHMIDLLPTVKITVLAEIARIERKWNLI